MQDHKLFPELLPLLF